MSGKESRAKAPEKLDSKDQVFAWQKKVPICLLNEQINLELKKFFNYFSFIS